MALINNLLISLFLLSLQVAYSQQTCPTATTSNFRNNGLGGTCLSGDSPPSSSSTRTGRFTFQNSSTSNNLTIDSILLNGQRYQIGTTLYQASTIWFGGYNGSSNDMCFYGTTNSDNAVPAGRWQLFYKNSSNQTVTCPYTIDASGNTTTFSSGTISSAQTICSGSSPAGLTGTAASNCSGGTITYQWQSSTTSSTSGFTNISLATDVDYSPSSLSTTTWYQRLATCSANSVTINSDPIKITVISAGTISPTPGTTWSGATTTFSTNGTSGGTWSVITSPSGIASINSSGELTATASGSGTVTYSITSGGTTCSTTRNFTISGTSGSLPVTWETVSAEKQNGQSVLRWSTASEQNTKDFVIQHSLNTTDWSALSTIPAAGSSTTTRNYSYVHQNPLKGNNYNYYRILQRDLDDKFSYSKIVSIVFNEPGADLQVYPNPAEDVVTVFISEEQEVSLLNAAGALVWKSKLPAGRSQLPLVKFSSGLYFLRTKTQTIKLLIK
ncbi:MAG: T9SS type A sorting domain-containing protein [Bacteroidota bacterium]|jgi:hypothetical protein